MTILNTRGRYSSRLIYCAGAPNHFTQSGNLCHKIKTVFQYINNISTEDNFNIVKKKLQFPLALNHFDKILRPAFLDCFCYCLTLEMFEMFSSYKVKQKLCLLKLGKCNCRNSFTKNTENTYRYVAIYGNQGFKMSTFFKLRMGVSKEEEKEEGSIMLTST